MSEGLSRRRKIRGGHRGSATRMVHEIYEAIESTDERDSIVTKLEQCKISLEEKLEIIRQQDDEILELVGDVEVEHEINEADTFSGRVRRAIIDATRAIEVKLVPTSTQVTVSNPTTTDETSAPSTEASTVAAATTSAATETPTGAAAATTSATVPEVSETTPVSILTDATTPEALRRLHDQVESQVRGLRALGIAADSYGSLLSPVILKKLPQELRLIVSREVREGRWNLDELMRLIDVEIKARECASNTSNASTDGNRLLKAQGKSLPTNTALYSSESPVPKCSYCRQQHSSISCRTVTDPNERKQILRKAGRCFVCLRRHHTSRDCRSTLRCTGCGGRHHTSICNGRMMQDGARSQTIRQNKDAPNTGGMVPSMPTTTAAFQNSTTKVPVLLQTAQVSVFKPCEPTISMNIRAIFDSASQRSYISERVKHSLSLNTLYSETMLIKTFGSEKGNRQLCDAVSVGINLRAGGV
ncbi:uncharacterized protein [Dysidea avara]|uniref:uncharacterized protein n=1 Tax=Dysidea avara TaxID=196820 RepID=UPI003327FDA9